ncbi:unnamed protein product [Paramecium octaurelia]|uniref:Uncharacterized protein n=1 Tax=Paramecium octaurelia TaxID=43137 RepID=A0A8S1V637_PAROT|nr:unnamed protein product [Paramecium octaurelia]
MKNYWPFESWETKIELIQKQSSQPKYKYSLILVDQFILQNHHRVNTKLDAIQKNLIINLELNPQFQFQLENQAKRFTQLVILHSLVKLDKWGLPLN